MSSILVQCQRFLPVYGKGAKTGCFLCPLSPQPPIPEFVTPDHCAMSDLRLPSQLHNTGLCSVTIPLMGGSWLVLAVAYIPVYYIAVYHTCRRSPNSVTWLNVEQRPLTEHWPPLPTGINSSLYKKLCYRRGIARRAVSWNLVNCSTTVRRVIQGGTKTGPQTRDHTSVNF